VRQGVDHDLDELKRTYEGLESLLIQVAQHVAQSVPASLHANISVVFFPQIGFLIAIPQDPITGHGVFEGPENEPWEKMFTTEDFAYYKNENVIEMDSYFGDIYGRICDREIEIIHELAEKILQYEDLLTTASDVCAEIDCVLALAQGARNHNLVRPRLTESNILDIRGGRHILQEKVGSNFIPNDTLLAGGEAESLVNQDNSSAAPQYFTEDGNVVPSMILVTGPNFSGKSVYLKQVAIIVFMAHIGSFVPATKAEIGLTDKILTRVATRESVSRNQSAFMIDLQQISVALNLATNRSLLIIDEFGKGTNSHGNYKQGRSNNSYGTVCAALNGIPLEVTNRAEELILLAARGEDLVAACAILSESETKDLEESEDIARAFFSMQISEDPKESLKELLGIE
ncbi:hypothetical protein KCU71_g19642, partial [Aureobasidium melanogenum]